MWAQRCGAGGCRREATWICSCHRHPNFEEDVFELRLDRNGNRTLHRVAPESWRHCFMCCLENNMCCQIICLLWNWTDSKWRCMQHLFMGIVWRGVHSIATHFFHHKLSSKVQLTPSLQRKGASVKNRRRIRKCSSQTECQRRQLPDHKSAALATV